MQRSHLTVSILVAGIMLVGAIAWHGYQEAKQRALKAQQAKEAAAAGERRAAEIRQQQQQKREDFARACTEGTKFGVTCSAGGRDGTILAIAYGHANEDFLKGLVSDADSEGQPAKFGRDLAALGFTVLMATDGKRYWAAEPCSGSGVCKWYQEASEPNPWTPTVQPPPESLRIDKEVLLGWTGGHAAATYSGSFYAGKLVALAAETARLDKLNLDEQSSPTPSDCSSDLRQLAYEQSKTVETTQVSQDAYREHEKEVEAQWNRLTIQDLLARRSLDYQCEDPVLKDPALNGEQAWAEISLFRGESGMAQSEFLGRLRMLVLRHPGLHQDLNHESPGVGGGSTAGGSLDDLRTEEVARYVAYLERHDLINQLLVEDLVEVQVISHQQ